MRSLINKPTGHYFFDSKRECASESRINIKLTLRHKLKFLFVTGEPGSKYQLFYQLSIDLIAELAIINNL